MHVRQEIALAGDIEQVRKAVAEWADDYRSYDVGATVIPTTGYWHGEGESGAIVRFDWPERYMQRRRPRPGSHPQLAVHELHFRTLCMYLAEALPNEKFGHVTRQRVDFEELRLEDLR